MFSFLHDLIFLEKSKNVYILPLLPKTPIKNILYDWPSHQGIFKGAVDFAVDLKTPVIAPLDGQIIEVVDKFDKHGPTKDFVKYLNYITIAHSNGEFSQLAHIAKKSSNVKVGEGVKKGQVLALTGLSGWMMEPFLEHLHMFIFKLTLDGSIKGLKIRFLEKPKETLK